MIRADVEEIEGAFGQCQVSANSAKLGAASTKCAMVSTRLRAGSTNFGVIHRPQQGELG